MAQTFNDILKGGAGLGAPVPVGHIIYTPYAGAAPAGYLDMTSGTFDPATYPDLEEYITSNGGTSGTFPTVDTVDNGARYIKAFDFALDSRVLDTVAAVQRIDHIECTHVLERGITTIWKGNISTSEQQLSFSEGLSTFEAIIVEVTSTLGYGVSGLSSCMFLSTSLLNAAGCTVFHWTTPGTATDNCMVGLTAISENSAVSNIDASGAGVGAVALTAVYGVKY